MGKPDKNSMTEDDLLSALGFELDWEDEPEGQSADLSPDALLDYFAPKPKRKSKRSKQDKPKPKSISKEREAQLELMRERSKQWKKELERHQQQQAALTQYEEELEEYRKLEKVRAATAEELEAEAAARAAAAEAKAEAKARAAAEAREAAANAMEQALNAQALTDSTKASAKDVAAANIRVTADDVAEARSSIPNSLDMKILETAAELEFSKRKSEPKPEPKPEPKSESRAAFNPFGASVDSDAKTQSLIDRDRRPEPRSQMNASRAVQQSARQRVQLDNFPRSRDVASRFNSQPSAIIRRESERVFKQDAERASQPSQIPSRMSDLRMQPSRSEMPSFGMRQDRRVASPQPAFEEEEIVVEQQSSIDEIPLPSRMPSSMEQDPMFAERDAAQDRYDGADYDEDMASRENPLGVILIVLAVICVLVAASLLTGLWDISNL